MSDPAFNSSRPSVSIDGELRDDIHESLTDLVVNLPQNGMAHAEMTLTNWGGREGENDPDFLYADLALGQRLQLAFGEEDPQTVFDGEITALEECYGDGAPQLVILLQDKLHHLGRKRRSRAFEEQTPDDIVGEIASDAGLQSDVGVSTTNTTFHQINESDLAFLYRLLGRFDVPLRLSGDTLRARLEEPDQEPVQLDAQDSALRVRLIADLNHQYASSQVLGYNVETDEANDATADALQPAPPGTTAAQLIGQLGWPGDEVVAQPFARSAGEANEFSRANFKRCAKRFISGEIQCQGEPTLRSGREIELAGVSTRLSGKYQVVHCVHRFDGSQGYQTHLRVNRASWSDT